MRKTPVSDKNVDKMHVRLRHARICAGFKTAIAAANRFKWSVSTFRAHENGQNAFDALTAIRYARAFNIAPTWLLLGDEASIADAVAEALPAPVDRAPRAAIGVIDGANPSMMDGRMLRPASAAVAGAFSIPCDARYPRDAQFLLIVEGDSVNRVARDGDLLLCVDAAALGAPPKHGDLVLIEIAGPTGCETSIRRLRRTGDRIEFFFDSNHPAWRESFVSHDGRGLTTYGFTILARVLFVFRNIAEICATQALMSDQGGAGVFLQAQENAG